jgi:hypothetical protein
MNSIETPDWINELSDDNLLAVYDVALDVRDELQIHDDVVIPLYRQVVRFRQLCPASSPGLADRYCELRYKAVELLKGRGVIEEFEMLKAYVRWDSRLSLRVDPGVFGPHFEAIEREYMSRQGRLSGSKGSLAEAIANDPLDVLRAVLRRFHAAAVQLRSRHENRPTLDVSDEYDVQDLLHALLCLHFDDIRPEEWSPSYAGKSSRVDFLLKPEKIVVEVKKTRLGLGAKELGDQLIIDKERYSKMGGCELLVCFIYDPENRVGNAAGLEADLTENRESFKVEVMVLPKQY